MSRLMLCYIAIWDPSLAIVQQCTLVCKNKVRSQKLACLLNEEAERTGSPIRRLGKVMYRSTCADMQEQLSGGFSCGRPRGTIPQMTGTLSYRPEETGGRQREKSLDTRLQETGRPISPYVYRSGQKTARWWSVARRPHRTVCTFNACPSEKAFSVVPGTRNWRDNEWGRVLFTDESRFSLSSDSHHTHLERVGEATIIPRTSLKGTGMEVTVFSFGEASCFAVVQTFTSSTQVQSTEPVIVTRFFFHICASF
ncbi:hypothetical protein TNCV_1158851 [Trichonephila clavipes]|nr:hypothetical protein TNCV_1158851 [Trichonephila clavipes]